MKTENLAEYVRELHEFSATYHVPFGQPEDLKKLLERLDSSETFAADFGSMIRSFVFREHFSASPSELLDLVALAWGGETGGRSPSQSREELKELRTILEKIVRGGAGEPPPSLSEEAEAPRSTGRAPSSKASEAIAVRRNAEPSIETPEKRERVPPPDSSLMRLALQRSAEESLNHSSPLLFQNSPYAAPPEKSDEEAPKTRRGPGPTDILAFGLAGVMVALLATATSLPVYRVHVSIFVPSISAGSSSGSEEDLLRDGTLTRRAAQRLLLQPHSNPILRQDALSRAMRDLQVGGRETILYASLVAHAEHEVKIRPLQTPGLYEITCDSWSSRFAETFCNALVDTVDPQTEQSPGSEPAETSARKIDAAVSPGIQIYPHWYLQSILGFACGCIAGALYGLIGNIRPATDD